MSFRERLRDEISYKGFQKKEFAAKIGISYSTFLSYIDKREIIPPADVAVCIASVLEISVEYLVTGTEARNIPKHGTFYNRYSKFEAVLQELEKLSNDTYNEAEHVLLATVRGLQDTEGEKNKKLV